MLRSRLRRSYDARVPVTGAPLLERERELEEFERLRAAARRGEGAAAVVEGPAGIGKTRLLAAAGEGAEGLEVLRARASELERDFPFGVVRQLFEPVLFAAGEEQRSRLLAGAGGLAERVLSGSAAADGGGSGDPFAVLHGLYWFTANLAGLGPVLLLVDDAQWADAASLRWLSFLLHRLEGVPLALLLGVRTGEAGSEEGLLDELLSDPGVRVLQPAPLSGAGVAQLVERALGTAPDPRFLRACQQATAGNPFLVRELLVVLTAQGVTPTADHAAVVGQLSSSRVGRSVRARLRRLPTPGLELARAVSVLGDGCELPVAATLAELGERAATQAADALVAASILAPSRPLAFVHPLVRASVYGELGAGERSDWHRRAARTLGAGGAAPDRVAVHLLPSNPRGDAEAVATLRLAAASASGRGAPEVSVTYLRRAFAEPAPDELRAVLAYELGSAALRAGDLELAIEQLRVAVHGLPEAGRRAPAADELTSALILLQRAEEAVAELTEVINQLPEGERERGLRLQATRLAAALANVEAWRRRRASGTRFVVKGTQPVTTGERLQLVEQALNAVREGTAASARELALRALGHRELLEDPGPESPAFWGLPAVLLMAHAYEDAARVCGEAIEWARRHGSQPAFALHAQFRAFASMKLGALDDAEADAVSGLQHAAIPRPIGLTALGVVLVERGRLGEAEELLTQERFGRRSVRVPWFLEARARVHAAGGRLDEALEELFECGRIEQDWDVRTPAFSTWRASAAPLLASRGRHDEAIGLAREELERCRAFAAPGPTGAALRTLGTLTDGDAGLALLEEAVEVLRPSPERLELARALLEQGAALRRGGRRAGAREPLRRALELARGCGAEVLAACAHDELVAAGARPRRDPTESRSRLTASELRVARLAADGLTNREIAQALFVTEKTVETHLRSVFRKLAIGSRSQLARTL
jgi:DNA-binding CsgD family transcriptional regulator/tetratricopeptide (TPR) repeat protein